MHTWANDVDAVAIETKRLNWEILLRHHARMKTELSDAKWMEVIADAKRYSGRDREIICLFETSKQIGGFAFLQVLRELAWRPGGPDQPWTLADREHLHKRGHQSKRGVKSFDLMRAFHHSLLETCIF